MPLFTLYKIEGGYALTTTSNYKSYITDATKITKFYIKDGFTDIKIILNYLYINCKVDASDIQIVYS